MGAAVEAPRCNFVSGWMMTKFRQTVNWRRLATSQRRACAGQNTAEQGGTGRKSARSARLDATRCGGDRTACSHTTTTKAYLLLRSMREIPEIRCNKVP